MSVEEFLAGDWPADAWLVDGEVVVNDPVSNTRRWWAASIGRWRIGATPDLTEPWLGGNWIFGPYTLLRPDGWWRP